MNCWLHLHNMEPEQMVELAILAETLGFEGVVGDDHWFMPAGALDHKTRRFAGADRLDQPGAARGGPGVPGF